MMTEGFKGKSKEFTSVRQYVGDEMNDKTSQLKLKRLTIRHQLQHHITQSNCQMENTASNLL